MAARKGPSAKQVANIRGGDQRAGARIPGTRIKAMPGTKFGKGTGSKAGMRGAGKGGAGDM